MLVDDGAVFGKPSEVEDGIHGKLTEPALVRRVDEDEVKLTLPRTQHAHEIGGDDAEVAIHPFEVLPHKRDGSGVSVDEHHLFRTARQTLDAKGSAAREEVEHARAFHLPLQDVEDGFLDPVRGWTHAVVGGRRELSATVLSADDSHLSPPNSL